MKKVFRLLFVPGLIIFAFVWVFSCEEEADLPEVSTNVTGYSKNTATVEGNVTDDGGAKVTARGICWSEEENPTTLNDNTIEGSGTGTFTSTLTDLTAGTTYYARAYAENKAGIAYGNEVSFNTNAATLPVLTTDSVTSIMSVTAVSGGDITDDGGSEITARGVCWSTEALPTVNDDKTTDGAGTGSFTSHITGLEPDYGYYVRAYATSSAGTGYGEQYHFYTIVMPPVIYTLDATDITSYSAVSGGYSIDPADTPISSRGIRYTVKENDIYSPSQALSIEAGPGDADFTSTMTGLIMDTVYYVVAYATNGSGTSYGEVKSFRTGDIPAPVNFNQEVTYGSVSDIDGNSYKTVTVGTQTWMAENLKTTHYNDGTEITLVVDDTDWAYSGTEGYCWYNNDEAAYKDVYGALYKIFAVKTDKLCPAGWHVPTDAEWSTLMDYLGGGNVAGGKMKESGNTHWNGTNAGATNVSGFTALPGGWRQSNGPFYKLGSTGYFWSDGIYPYNTGVTLKATDPICYSSSFSFKDDGVSVRCVKD